MNKEQRRERTKKEFILASKKIIEQEGIDSLSVRKVGEESGYSYATIYNYFKDVNTLLVYVSLEYLQEAFTYTMQDAQNIRHPLDRLLHYTKRYMEYMIDHPYIFYLIFIQDIGDPTSMKEEITPQVSQSLYETLLELDVKKFKLSVETTYQLITSSVHSKILFHNTKRGFTTKQELFYQIEKEIREVTNQ